MEINFDHDYFFSKPSTTQFAKYIQTVAQEKSSNIFVNFTWDVTISPQYGVLVAALHYVGRLNGNKVYFKFNYQFPKIRSFLTDTGIAKKLKRGSTVSSIFPISNSQSVDFHISRDSDEAVERIGIILERLPIKTSDLAHAALFSIYYELFDNAFTHSKSQTGVFSCGTTTPENDFVFSIYDLGVGIPTNVREYLKSGITDCEALEWALKNGNSTLQAVDRIPRGLGLARLVSLTRVNCGEMVVVTGSAYCRIDKNQTHFATMDVPLLGTLFMFKVVHDKLKTYVLQEEYDEKNHC